MSVSIPPPSSRKFSSWLEYLLGHQNGAILTARSSDTVKTTSSSKKKADIIDTLLSEPQLPLICRKSPDSEDINILHSFTKFGGSIRNPSKSYYALSSLDDSIRIVKVNLEGLLASSEIFTPAIMDLENIESEESLKSESNELLLNKFQGRKCIAIPPLLLAGISSDKSITENYIGARDIFKDLQHEFEQDNITTGDPNLSVQSPRTASSHILAFLWGLANNKVDHVPSPTSTPPQEVISHFKYLHHSIIEDKSAQETTQQEEDESQGLQAEEEEESSQESEQQSNKRRKTSSQTGNIMTKLLSNQTSQSGDILKELSRLRSSAELFATAHIQFQRDSITQKEEKKIKISQASKDLILTASQHNEHHVVHDFVPTMKEFLSCKSETIARQLIIQKLVRLQQIPIHIPRGTISALYNGFFIWPSPSNIKHFTLFSFPPYEEGENALEDDSAYDLQLAIQRKEGNERYDKQQIKDLLKQDLFIPKTIDALIQHLANGAATSSFLFGPMAELSTKLENCHTKVYKNRLTFMQYHAHDPLFPPRFLHAIDKRVNVFLAQCELGVFNPEILNFNEPINQVITSSQFYGILPKCLMPKKNEPKTPGGGDGNKNKDKERKEREKREQERQEKAIKNPQPWGNWIVNNNDYRKLHKNIQNCPKLNGEQICARWHCLGKCYKDCPRKASHLCIECTSPEGAAFEEWIQTSVLNS